MYLAGEGVGLDAKIRKLGRLDLGDEGFETGWTGNWGFWNEDRPSFQWI